MEKETKTVNNKRVEILTDVPASDVDRIINEYKVIEGLTDDDIEKEEQPNGMFKITATFPVNTEED